MYEYNQGQVPVEKEKKGVKTSVVILLCVAVAVIACIGGWFLGTQFADTEDKGSNTKTEEKNESNDSNQDDDITQKPNDSENSVDNNVINNSYTFYTTKKITKKLNNKDVVIYVNTYIDKEKLNDCEDDTKDFYVVRRDIVINGKNITGTFFDFAEDNEKDAERLIFEFDLIEYLKDAVLDTQYLVLSVTDNSLAYSSSEMCTRFPTDVQNTYFVTEDGVVLKKYKSKDAGASLIGVLLDKKNIGDKKYIPATDYYEEDEEFNDKYFVFHDSPLDLHTDYFYYLEDNDTYYSEYKVQITNGKVEQVFIQKYDEKLVHRAGAE